MKKLLSAALLLCLVLPAGMARAQAIVDEIPMSYQRRIKLIDQFMSRFNGTDVPEGVDPNDKQLHRKLLLTLFDHDYLMRNQQQNLAFVDSVLARGYKLQYEDTTWYAIAECDAYMDGKLTKVYLAFRTRRDSKGLMKWVISRASGDVLDLAPSKSSSLMKISPVDNELDFIHLKDITTENVDLIMNYSDPLFSPDQTSVFFALVHSGKLQVSHVANLSYQFDIGEYMVFVNRYNRDTNNSGWLISNIVKR